MSLTYSLVMASEQEPRLITQFLARGLGLKPIGDDLKGQGVIIGVGIESKFGQDIIEETFGFRPTVNVVFHIYPSEGYEEGYHIMARATAALLRQLGGSAVLLRSSELPILQRLNGKVLVNEGWGEWLIPELEAAKIDYVNLTPKSRERDKTA